MKRIHSKFTSTTSVRNLPECFSVEVCSVVILMNLYSPATSGKSSASLMIQRLSQLKASLYMLQKHAQASLWRLRADQNTEGFSLRGFLWSFLHGATQGSGGIDMFKTHPQGYF